MSARFSVTDICRSSVWVFHTGTWAGQNANYIGIRDLAPGHRKQMKLLTCHICMVALECRSYGNICHEYKFQSRKWMSPTIGQQLPAAEDRV